VIDAILAAELQVGSQPVQYDEDIPIDHVIELLHDDRPLDGVEELLKNDVVDLVVSGGPEPRSAPILVNMTLEEAAARAAELQLVVAEGEQVFSDEVPAGRVVSQSPLPEELVERGGTIVVQLSKGPDLRRIPDLTEATVSRARAALEAEGLVLGAVFGPDDGVVFRTGRGQEAGTLVRPGTSVDIYTE